MKKKIPYTVRLCLAISRNDDKLVTEIVMEAVEEMSRELVKLSHKYDTSDLPLFLAALDTTKRGIGMALPKEATTIGQTLARRISCVTIDYDEITRQATELQAEDQDDKEGPQNE